MEQLPSAEEFLIKRGCVRTLIVGEKSYFFEYVQPKDLIEFAKLHVEKALKQASEKAQIQIDEHDLSCSVNKKSILNAYPLDNIK